MQDTGKRRDSSGGYLSQLRCLYQNRSFIRKGLFSVVLFFSFGMSGTLPFFPPVDADTDMYAQPSSVTSREENEIQRKERCRLEGDVKLFLHLRDQGRMPMSEEAPSANHCEEALSLKTELENPEDFPKSNVQLGMVIQNLVAGYPLEAMTAAISQYDPAIAGLIVGIAKKESDWGKRVPRDVNGDDCFNYWGYKGAGSRGTAMGHGCFGSKEEAVTAIGERLKTLVALRQGSEPKNMIVWKCGSSCSGHSDASVRKWIADVSLYYDRIVVQ